MVTRMKISKVACFGSLMTKSLKSVSRTLSKLLQLAVIPSIIFFPSVPLVAASSGDIQTSKENSSYTQKPSYSFESYDDILSLLNDLESDEIERWCSEDEIEQITNFLITLAQEGAQACDQIDTYTLEDDIEDLLVNEDSSLEFAFYTDSENHYSISPAVMQDQAQVILCKGKITKALKKVKKFVKKHKKAIIIGAVVVVAVAAVVVVTVVVTSASAGAATAAGTAATTKASGGAGAAIAAGAGGAAAAAGSQSNTKSKDKDKPEKYDSPLAADTDTPLTYTIPTPPNDVSITSVDYEEYVYSIKNEVFDGVSQYDIESALMQNNNTFIAQARDMGSIVAHKVLDETRSIYSEIPEVLEVLMEHDGKHPLPFSATSPTENYNESVAVGHNWIDQVFSTNRTNQYTPEAKENAI